MSDLKLTDFTKSELQALLNVVAMREVELSARINERKELFQSADVIYPSDLKCVVDDHSELETLQLWHVQILHAIGKVGRKEEIHSN